MNCLSSDSINEGRECDARWSSDVWLTGENIVHITDRINYWMNNDMQREGQKALFIHAK